MTIRMKEAKGNIARQQQVLKTILDVTPDLVSLQDGGLRCRAVNPAFRRLLGLSEPDIIGKSDVDIFPPKLAEIARGEDLEILKTGLPLSKEILISRGDGKHWFHMVKVPVYDENRIAGLLFMRPGILRKSSNFRKSSSKP